MKTLSISAILLTLAVAPVLAQDEVAYTNESVARLSHLSGTAFLQRAADLGYEECQVNMPVTAGDRLGTTDGRLEVQLGRRNFVRLDTDTKVDFLNFPDKRSDFTRIKVWAGNIYLSLAFLPREKAVEVHTSDASLYFLEKGLVRIDVLENDRTEIQVVEGTVEVSGNEGSNILGAGQKIEAAGGRFLSRPARLQASLRDSFDEWNDGRDALLVDRQASSRYLPEEIWEYEPELDAYGDWMYMAPYGHVWIPRGMGPGWRPYFYGRWMWIPFCGWTWVSYDPWGWAPFHYGRWHWDPFYGWYWIPTGIWGPAWVSWWWGWDYYGWAPLSWYGYPGVIINNRYYDRYRGDYPHDSRALTVVRRSQLKAPDISRVTVVSDVLKDTGKISLSTDLRLAPRPEPGGGVALEKLEGGRVILRSRDASSGEERVIRGRGTRAESGTDRGSVIRGRDEGGAKSGEKSGTAGRGTSTERSSPRVIERAPRTETEGKSSQPASTSEGSTERKIRKKDDEDGSAYDRSGSYGYPSSAESGRSLPAGRSSSWSSSPTLSRIYDRIVNRSSSSSSSGSSARISSGSRSGGSSAGSRSGGSSSSRSGSAGSSSRSSSSARKKD
jgi:hypothetical protein